MQDSVINDELASVCEDDGVKAVVRFLEDNPGEKVVCHSDWAMVSKKPINVSFRLDGDDCFLICNRPAVSDVIVGMARRRSPATMQCLVTGEWEEPQRLHGAIKRITDGESSGNPLVSFNLNSFESYGLDQGRNASIGRLAEHKYWTALSALLMRNSHQRIQVGDATTVFWSEKAHPMENLFGDLFDPPKENPSAGVEAVKALFAAPETGAPPLAGDRTRFHILGLAPNASRLAIRFWHMGTIGEVAGRIRRHFDDLDLIHGEKESGFLPLWRLLAATALQGKANNVPPNLAGDVMKAILNGTPYPRTLLAAAVRRTRAERDVTYPRTVLIKAVLVRANRSNPKEVGMALDRENINIGYRLGRLFAVLEKAQLDGHGWRYGDDHKTIMDSYYGAASATPNAVFGRLLRLSKHHLAKIERPGIRGYREREIGEIMDGIEGKFPATLDLDNQGRFAIGYYHQRQDFFKKKETKEEEKA